MVGIWSSCGACKFLRRKCEDICIFAPYFSYDQAEVHFAAVHKVFGASNVSKLLSHLPMCSRSAAAITVSYEAQARIRDPVRGCVSHILALQQQVASLQAEIGALTEQMVRSSSSAAEFSAISPRAMVEFFAQRNNGDATPGNGGEVGLQPGYKEAIDQLEDCLFSDHEPKSWEEMAIYASDLEKDLLYLYY